MSYIFQILSTAFSVYSILCVVRIIFTWIPSVAYSPVGRFLSVLCDPFLNMFSSIKWLRLGPLDFSPLLSLAVLSMASFIFKKLAKGGHITLALILELIVKNAWLIISALLFFLIIIVAIRLIVFLTGNDKNSAMWSQIDSSLNPLIFSVANFFWGGGPVSYKTALIVALVFFLILRFGGGILIDCLLPMCF